MELAIDFISLILSIAISYVFVRFALGKISGDVGAELWVKYIICNLLAFCISYFGFHTSVNIKERNKIAEFINTIKNDILVFLMFTALLAIIKNPLLEQRTMIGISFILFFVFTITGRYYLKRWLTGEYGLSKAKITSYVVSVRFLKNSVSSVTLPLRIRSTYSYSCSLFLTRRSNPVGSSSLS